MNTRFTAMLFDVETNTNVSGDFEPAISIDVTSRISENIKTLRTVLGVTKMIPLSEDATIKIYKTIVTKAAGGQEAEGDVIPLSKVTRTLAKTVTLSTDFYRRLTTFQAINKVGRYIALNEADQALVKSIRKDVKARFFSTITADGITAALPGGGSFQKAVANVWAALSAKYEDTDVTPVFFVNPIDVATYLGDASILNNANTTFGFMYLKNFMGMGNAIISAEVPQGKVLGTVSENLNGAYLSADSDAARAFNMTYDETRLVGMTHAINTERASIETLVACEVVFYAEDLSGVFYSEIAGEGKSAVDNG